MHPRLARKTKYRRKQEQKRERIANTVGNFVLFSNIFGLVLDSSDCQDSPILAETRARARNEILGTIWNLIDTIGPLNRIKAGSEPGFHWPAAQCAMPAALRRQKRKKKKGKTATGRDGRTQVGLHSDRQQ